MKNLTYDPVYDAIRKSHTIFDDFTRDIDAAEWVKTSDANGTIAVGDAVGGICAISTIDALDNNETYMESPNETYKVVADKPIIFETRVQFTEGNTDDANIIVGLKDAVGANTLQDDGAGPPSSYSGMVFFKEDGQTLWSVETSLSTTQTTTQLTAALSLDKTAHTAGTSAAYQWLRIEVRPYSSTNAKVNFFIDDVHVASHDYIYTNATEMQICFGVKCGGATAEVLNVDKVYCRQAI